MKKRWSILLVLILVLGLSACGDGRKMAYGTVAEVRTGDGGEITAIVVDGDGGKQFGALLTEETWTIPWSDGDAQIDAEAAFQAQLQPGARVAVEQLPGRQELETAGGGNVRAYEAYCVNITAILRRGAAELADGTSLDILDHGSFSGVTYCLPDGTQLLNVRGPYGPEGYYVMGLESFADLSQRAQEKVSAYYEAQGALYDERAELEKAYSDWKAKGEEFRCHWVEQDVSPSASSEKVMYFCTHVTLPLDQGDSSYSLSLGEAFDRETGEHLSLWDLFRCPEEEARQAILDAALDWAGSDGVRAGMEAAFTPERVIVNSDSLSMDYEPGTLPGEEHGYIVSADLNKIQDLMYSWAVPMGTES